MIEVKRVRGKSLVSMSLILIFLVSLVMVNGGYTADSTTVYVDPPAPVFNPTETFDVNIKVTGAPELVGFEFKLRWDITILEYPPVATEGDFLKSAGETDFRALGNYVEAYIHVGCHLTSTVASPPSGDGTLATLTFYVLESGISDLVLLEVKLYDYATGGQVPDVTTTDGTFQSTKPYVDFTWTPVSPELGEIATFNATACEDPDGGTIESYTWDFGDGTDPVTTTEPYINHSFSEYNDAGYPVNLTVLDDDGETWFKTTPLRLWHDIVAADIWPTDANLDEVYWDVNWAWHEPVFGDDGPYGGLWLLATIVNMGTYDETVDVYLYADLDTSVIGDEYVIANIAPMGPWYWEEALPYATIPVAAHAGSGWLLWFNPEMFLIWEEGDYTLTLVAEPVPGETATEDNTFTGISKLNVIRDHEPGEGGIPLTDLNVDNVTDVFDIISAAIAFGAYPGHARWRNKADLNNDDIVDIFDIVMIANEFGAIWG